MTASVSPPPAPVLDARQAGFLFQLLLGNDPQHLHFEQPLWTPQALAEIVGDEFGVALTDACLMRCLDELGLAPADPLLDLPAGLQAPYRCWLQTELPRRLPRGAGFRGHMQVIEEPLPADPAAAAAVLNQAIEALVEAAPTQYLWGYNRYKQPRGAEATPAPAPLPN